MIEGRSFTETDTHASTPVLIVNRQFAHTYFHSENPIGQHIRIGKFTGPDSKIPFARSPESSAMFGRMDWTNPRPASYICL